MTVPILFALIVAHHVAIPSGRRDLSVLAETKLKSMAAYGVAAWPAARAATARMWKAPSDSLLQILEVCGPQAVADFAKNGGPHVRFSEQMLQHPAAYPLSWIMKAEGQLSTEHPEPPLVDEAREQAWFPETLD